MSHKLFTSGGTRRSSDSFHSNSRPGKWQLAWPLLPRIARNSNFAQPRELGPISLVVGTCFALLFIATLAQAQLQRTPSQDTRANAQSFVFFTVCAGHIELAPAWNRVEFGSTLTNAAAGFPFLCLDSQNQVLGANDFVAGYSEVFVYGDGSAN